MIKLLLAKPSTRFSIIISLNCQIPPQSLCVAKHCIKTHIFVQKASICFWRCVFFCRPQMYKRAWFDDIVISILCAVKAIKCLIRVFKLKVFWKSFIQLRCNTIKYRHFLSLFNTVECVCVCVCLQFCFLYAFSCLLKRRAYPCASTVSQPTTNKRIRKKTEETRLKIYAFCQSSL